MARRKPKPKSDLPKLNMGWFKVGGMIACAGAIVLAVCYFEGVNRYVQADRRLTNDPVVAKWYLSAKETVSAQAGADAPEGRPTALWYGTIKECRKSNPRSGRTPELLAIKLTEVRLMAGAKGKHDKKKSEVIISTRNAAIAPQVGEQWLFSVWRDEQGYNHTQSACLYRDAGGSSGS